VERKGDGGKGHELQLGNKLYCTFNVKGSSLAFAVCMENTFFRFDRKIWLDGKEDITFGFNF
jgi:hypothetical protein